MAEVRPFRGLRYGPNVPLGRVICPPYDVISPEQAAGYRRRSPFNAINLELPAAPAPPTTAAPAPLVDPTGRYREAARLLDELRRSHTLVLDAEPYLYVVDSTYRGPDGRQRTRRGFIARLRLEDLAAGVVLPHEKTHAGPMADRLNLMRATHSNFSQIFLLYADDKGEIAAALTASLAAQAPAASATTAAAPPAAQSVTDDDGTAHELTPVTGATAAQVSALLAQQHLYIADGHHRYEMALAYRDERRAAGDHSADEVMVYLCGMQDPGLMVFPTHRLIKDVALPPMAEVIERLEPAFAVSREGSGDQSACRRMVDSLSSFADLGKVFGLYFPREQSCLTAELRDLSAADRLLAEGFSPDAARLSVTILHYLILRDALGLEPTGMEGKIDYEPDPAEAFRKMNGGDYEIGAFLNPTLLSEVKTIADHGETMPQKATYFYPKPLTGLVFNVMDED